MRYEKDYDVLIAGGGIAGVAAALEAARSGLRTALVEKTVFPGGCQPAGWRHLDLSMSTCRSVTVTERR